MAMSLTVLNNLKYGLDLSRKEWLDWLCSRGHPKFTADQVVEWVYKKGILDPQKWTNLSKNIREEIAQSFYFITPQIESHLISNDQSEKFLLKTKDNEFFEMVLMPYDNRVTLCISSQVGCRMGCNFCQTGKMGLKRNLTSGEIISQILIAKQRLGDRKLTNVVFMGMGEPLDNYDEVIKACRFMVDPKAVGLSMHRVTISTSGLVPEIIRLGKELPLRLAISLHNADNETRSAMMPVNRKYNLEQLKKALIEYPAPRRLGITFEYVMIEGKNDSIEDAKKLVRYLTGIKAKVNLIPINHFPGLEMKASAAERLRRFQSYLAERSIPAPVRYSRGQDISGGCGQLAAKRKNELHMDPRILASKRRKQQREANKR